MFNPRLTGLVTSSTAARIGRRSGRNLLTACALVLALPLLHEGASSSTFAGPTDGCSAFAACDQTEDHKLTASDATAHDRLGGCVSVSGDTAVVGAAYDHCAAGIYCGSAYVYRFDGSSWLEEAKLTASDAAAMDDFGISVSISGDTVVVGAAFDDCAAGANCGSAYVYRFDGSSWVEEAKLTASDAAVDDRFGVSVSLSGDTAVVGAHQDGCAAGLNCGSAYVYRFDGSSWVEEAKLSASDAAVDDSFGYSVSVSGDTAVVGASGSAYVYNFDGSSWVERAKLAYSAGAAPGYFGRSVCVSGDTAVVGAYGDNCAGGVACGSAYVYRFDGSSWVEEAKLTASDAAQWDQFGDRVSVSGDTVVVGAFQDDCATGANCGSAYVYRFNGSSWMEEAKLTASDAAVGDYFGRSVSVSGDRAVVGANRVECAAGNDCGSAYVFDRSAVDCNCNSIADECEMSDCNKNCIEDADDIANLTSPDCNTNGIPDECELLDNDCNESGVPDECEMSDCNENCIDDADDIANLTSPDCNTNGIPDECELLDNDCNDSSVPDECELLDNDCNTDGVPDECELLNNDCNTDGVPDDCELVDNDCDNSGVPDECELLDNDCNSNGVHDECEMSDCNDNCIDDADDIFNLTSPDCNANGIPDQCEIDENSTAPGSPFLCDPAAPPAGLEWCDRDCNDSGVPDDCELIDNDCNDSGVPDECERLERDCNTNGVPDECEMSDCNENCIDDADDIANLTSPDCDTDGVPDECELFANDCNDSGTPDECELVDNDCNGDGRPDECGVVIDCDRTEDHVLTASDGRAGDAFGGSVSVSGDTAVVGAYGAYDTGPIDGGSAYVYRFYGSSWVEEDKLTASDDAVGDSFGVSVSVSGNTAIVGAYGDDCAAGSYCGSAYVYRFDGSSWVEEDKLTASDAAEYDFFGTSVSVSGDTVVVGAYGKDCAGGYSCGSAYVFRFNGSSWVEEAKLTASDVVSHYFGSSVSVSGDTAVVGADANGCAAGGACGAAYVYHFDGSSWVEEAKLTASDAAASDRFGVSASVSGDTVVVGAPYHNCAAGMNCGSAYVYRFDGSAWVQEAKLTTSDTEANDLFGVSVSVSGGTAIVTAIGAACAAGINCGSAYVYRFDGSVWVEKAKLTLSDAANWALFGASVSVHGDTAVVGAVQEPLMSGRAAAAYVFDLSGYDSDCDAIADECEPDCNSNGVPDDSEIDENDCNANGILDACECFAVDAPTPEPGGAAKNRYVSLNLAENACRVALRMTFVDPPIPYGVYTGVQMWVGAPVEVTENAGKVDPVDAPGFPTFWAAPLQCDPYYTNWSAFPVVHVYDEIIVPEGEYDIQAITESCQETSESSYSAPLTVTQSQWGDVISDCATAPCGPPDGIVNVTTDVTSVLNKFKNLDGAPIKARSDLDMSLPDQKINISDVTLCLEAFGGFDYPYSPGSAPPPCP